MCDDDPYNIPEVNEADWYHGRHLGSQIQSANWQIVNCTTPANYFHVLRRQASGVRTVCPVSEQRRPPVRLPPPRPYDHFWP
jgi:2-oxoglutarate dehydrogenase complex dehydrogenase (E1) component-like enzyme